MQDRHAKFKKMHLGIILKGTTPSEASVKWHHDFDRFSRFPVWSVALKLTTADRSLTLLIKNKI